MLTDSTLLSRGGLNRCSLWGRQVMIASGSLTDTLQTLQDSSRRPLVVASADRADVLLGLAAVNMSGVGPHAAGVIATDGTKIGVRPALAPC